MPFRSRTSSLPPYSQNSVGLSNSQRIGSWLVLVIGSLMALSVMALTMKVLGHGLFPQDVPLQFWSVSTAPAHNSQHVVDPFSLLHAVSGGGLYLLLRHRWPQLSIQAILTLAVVCSRVWEVVETSPAIIALFNDSDSPGSYRGDSIINAVTDTGFVALGCFAAHRLPGWLSLASAAVAELSVALMIHDGFVLGTARLVRRMAIHAQVG